MKLNPLKEMPLNKYDRKANRCCHKLQKNNLFYLDSFSILLHLKGPTGKIYLLNLENTNYVTLKDKLEWFEGVIDKIWKEFKLEPKLFGPA